MNLLTKQKKAQEKVADWNERYEIGQAVLFEPMRGADKIKTQTRSVAWEACGQPLVSIVGKSGGVSLDFITAETDE